MRIAYVFTTFPKYSESFLQREIRALAAVPEYELALYSLIGGKGDAFERFPLRHLGWRDYLRLPWRLLCESVRKPAAFAEFIEYYEADLPRCPVNFSEQFLGFAFAVVYAKEIRRNAPDRLHAAWATGPATAALLLEGLTNTPFSMGAHAYDLHRNGGDCLLRIKCRRAAFIHTTTADAQRRLASCGADPAKIRLIRRGLDEIPPFQAKRPLHTPLRFLSVGRLLDKKGYPEQLKIYRKLLDEGIPLKAKIVGQGPLFPTLSEQIKRLRLEAHVELLGQKAFADVQQLYADWADVFIFTGKIAQSGDRDGLPNVIGEAMAQGVVIFSSPVAGTPEVIVPGQTGELLPLDQLGRWADAVRRITTDPAHCENLRRGAYDWVKAHFNASENAQRIHCPATDRPDAAAALAEQTELCV